jgi:23S rRNA (cytidine2498-2'-O)-methyltransferase
VPLREHQTEDVETLDVFVGAPEDELFLESELRRMRPSHRVEVLGSGVVGLSGRPEEVATSASVLRCAFARQRLPAVRRLQHASIREWGSGLALEVLEACREGGRWRLHVAARYAGVESEDAGKNRCGFIRAALIENLKRRRRRLVKDLVEDELPFTGSEVLVQLLLISPEVGFLSLTRVEAGEGQELVLSPFPLGEVPVATDKAAPSRAFSKLVESEQRMGIQICRGERCVDLGASPGSWSYVALKRGARVIAVDRSPLRDDLMGNAELRFLQGDAFEFEPERGADVDWLLCDVIAAPDRSIDLVLKWVRNAWARRYVVTIKFKGVDEYAKLERIKEQLGAYSSDYRLLRLCANKNEVCVFGSVDQRLTNHVIKGA